MVRKASEVTASFTLAEEMVLPDAGRHAGRRELSWRCTRFTRDAEGDALMLEQIDPTLLMAFVPVKSISDMPMVSRTNTRTGFRGIRQHVGDLVTETGGVRVPDRGGEERHDDARHLLRARIEGPSAASWWCPGDAPARKAADAPSAGCGRGWRARRRPAMPCSTAEHHGEQRHRRQEQTRRR